MIEAVNIDQENCTIGEHPYTFVADEAFFLEHEYWSTETAAQNSTLGKKIHRGQLVTYLECLEAVKDHLENFASVPFQFVGGEMLAMIARVHGLRSPATIIPLLKTPCISYCYLKGVLDQAISLALGERGNVKRIIENIPKDHRNFALVNYIFRGTNFFQRNLLSGAYELLNMINPHTIPSELWVDMFCDVYKHLPKIHKRRPSYTYEDFGKSICTSKKCICSSLWFCRLIARVAAIPEFFKTAELIDRAFKSAGNIFLMAGAYPLNRQRIRWALALDPTIISAPCVRDSKLLTDTMRLEAFFRGASFTCLSHKVQSGKKRIHGLGPDTIKKIITGAAKKIIKTDSNTLYVRNISDMELSLRTTEILAAVVVQNMDVFEEMTERAQRPSLCRQIFDHKVVHEPNYNKFAVKENAQKFLPFLMSIKSLQTRTHVALYGARRWGVLIDKRLKLDMSVENAVQYMIHVDTLIKDTALAIAPSQFSANAADLQVRPYHHSNNFCWRLAGGYKFFMPVFYLDCWRSGYSITAVFEDLHKHHQEYLRCRAAAAKDPWVMQENSKSWDFDNVVLPLDNLLNIWFWEQLIVHGLFNIYGLMLLRLDNELVCDAFRDRVVSKFLRASKDNRYSDDVYEIFKHLPQNFQTPEVCREAVALDCRCMEHVPQHAPNFAPPRGLVVASTSHESDVCPICLANYRDEERLWLTECKHLFHERCLAQWLGEVGTCAVCRSEL